MSSEQSLSTEPFSAGRTRSAESFPNWSIDRALSLYVTRAEQHLAFLRVAFCLLMFTLFLNNNNLSDPDNRVRGTFEAGVMILAALISLLVLHVTRQRTLTIGYTWLSVGADALICTGSLLTNTIAPPADYQGVLASVDVAAIFVVIAASVLRGNIRAVLLSALFNAAGLALVLGLEERLGLPFLDNKMRMVFGYFVGVVTLSCFVTRSTRGMLTRVAIESRDAERARSSVMALLQDYHDHSSLLFDMRLRLERLVERPALAAEENRLENISKRLTEFCDGFELTRDRTLVALRGLDAPELTEVGGAVQEAARETNELEVTLEVPDRLPPVRFGGGKQGLSVQIAHLLRNAAGGDGKTAATVATIAVSTDRDRTLSIQIRDNGPGFSPAQLSSLGRQASRSSKPGSCGLGLWLASRAIEAVGGRIRFENASDGGAVVTIRLPHLS